MKDNKNNEELQSRREFFKKAAKAALPVVGAAVMATIPTFANATKSTGCYTSGCMWDCEGSCQGGCQGCKDSCYGSCKGTCNAQLYY